MSSGKNAPARTPVHPPPAPLIGSLLRLPHEVIVARMLAALKSRGLELTMTELGVFLYPGPEGRRPVDLARQRNMTRQAMNYVLAGLERQGYVERQAGAQAATRVVRLTAKGREVVAELRRCVALIEQEWAAHLGAQRVKALRETLQQLCVWLGKLP
jgi:DNA-binding MarR family transcriptional regulator